MSRIIVEIVIPLLLPTVVWLLWWVFRGRHQPPRSAGDAVQTSLLQHGPWFWLALIGLVLLAATFVSTALLSGYSPEGRFVAPRWENDRVVPGRVE